MVRTSICTYNPGRSRGDIHSKYTRLRAYRGKRTGTHRISARCCCGRPVEALQRQRSLLRRSSLLPSLMLLLLWPLLGCRPSVSGLNNSPAVV